MDKESAKKLIGNTFQNSFNKSDFIYFIKNLLNQYDESKVFHLHGCYIPDSFKDYIKTYERIGTYTDTEGKKIDILIVYLKSESTVDRARTAQRNFMARYLKERGEKDAGLIAFVPPKGEDWRFSFVKMEYKFEKTPKGDVKVKEEFTPARRYSFLVGKNESSHTAQSCFVDILINDTYNLKLNEIEEAFNIEKVTKEFYEKYRNLFFQVKDALDEVVKKDEEVKQEFQEKGVNIIDFSKKLLGQIVFLYFLQKKGWFGVKEGQKWGTGPKNFLRELFEKKHCDYKNFFNDVLEPLFYEALRNDRSYDDHYFSYFKCKIPFLNGGLFDPINDYDWAKTDILLPDTLFSNQIKTKEGDIGTGILDIFDRYNFTVKEDEPLEKEVAVDPEMLGKVFENLLEVKDRKSKGTYYTPREIVHYMCQQSLINYLYTEVNSNQKSRTKEEKIQMKLLGKPDPIQQSLMTEKGSNIISKEDIEKLIKYGDTTIENDNHVATKGEETKTYSFKLPENIRKNAEIIDEALKNIRVCDPAIGSGAFPVGMMNEIISARNVLTPYLSLREMEGTKQSRTIYNFKRYTIQNCLYGVDIDPGAVEIAKLRLWLSLIVDEEDIKQIKPLPNLDYKIVCGNSLLGVKRNLENWKLFAKLEELKPLFFNESNINKKKEFKILIDELISEITNGHKDFDFEVYFSEIFHKKNGFDVVIANPPYLGEKGNKELFQKIRDGYLGKFYQRRMDLFYFFFHLSLNIGKQKSNIAFITTNYYPTATGAKALRRDFFNRGTLRILINFDELRIFESALGQHNLITMLSKDNDSNAHVGICITKRVGIATSEVLQKIMNWEDNETQYFSLPQADIYDNKDEFYIRSASISEMANRFLFHSIFSKINKNSELLGVICSLDQGIVSGADKVTESMINDYPELNLRKNNGIFVLNEEEVNNLNLPDTEKNEFIKHFYKNSDINKWRIFPRKKLFILYIKDKRESIALPPSLKTHFEQYKKILIDKKKNCFKNKWLRNIVEPWLLRGNYFVLFYPRDKQIFESIKIVNSRRAKSNIFAIEEEKMYEQSDIVITTLKDNFKTIYSIKYILCLLNSRLYYFWLYHKGKRKGETLELFQKPLSEIPIKKIPYEAQSSFIKIAEQILFITKNADYFQVSQKQAKVKTLEAEIDQMVYKLYNLTPEEIEVVGGFKKNNKI